MLYEYRCWNFAVSSILPARALPSSILLEYGPPGSPVITTASIFNFHSFQGIRIPLRDSNAHLPVRGRHYRHGPVSMPVKDLSDLRPCPAVVDRHQVIPWDIPEQQNRRVYFRAFQNSMSSSDTLDDNTVVVVCSQDARVFQFAVPARQIVNLISYCRRLSCPGACR